MALLQSNLCCKNSKSCVLIKRDLIWFFFVLIALLGAFFSNTLGNLFGSIPNYLIVLIYISFYVAIFVVPTKSIGLVMLKIYSIYLGFSFLWSYFLSDHYGFISGGIGIVGHVGLAGLWIFYFRSQTDKKLALDFLKKIVIFLGVFQGGAAIVQYFVSPNLFGLISNEVYVEGVVENINITKRAISFLSSPQSLSLFLAISFLVGFFEKGWLGRRFGLLIVFLAGILTFSKAFILTVFSAFLVWFLFNFSARSFFYSCVFFVIAAFSFFILNQSADFDGFTRFTAMPSMLLQIEGTATFKVWVDYLSYSSDFVSIFFGNGLGISSRQAQVILGYAILNGSPESFLLQIYFESGLVGLGLLLAIYFFSLVKLARMDKSLAIVYSSFFITMLGTPAFYGLANGAIFWLFTVYALFDGRVKAGVTCENKI